MTFIAGIDIGSSKICAVVARAGRTGLEVVGTGIARSEGVKRGAVVDIDAASRAVKKAVSDVEASSGVKVTAAYAGITGGHIGFVRNAGVTGVRGKVTEGDVRRAVQSASAPYLPLDRVMLHALPVDFSLDGQSGISNPRGMSGTRLESRVNVITASHSAVDNLLRCCEKAGPGSTVAVFGPVASARALLSAEEMGSGALLIDIGAGTTDIALYCSGMLRRAAVLPVGGGHMTSDIAIGLGISRDEAERIKRGCGDISEGSGLSAEGIISARCEEIFELLREGLPGACAAGVVLTGGASRTKGIDRLASRVFGLPARVKPAAPAAVPVSSVAMGLLMHGLEAERDPFGDVFDEVIDRVKGLLNRRIGVRKEVPALNLNK
jgi:cell division protein FtsA